ncbi:hypothetical protein B0H14DRAFT_3872767 [Mycena olivaceomarginata]|nr:hypothetical protein B0H14DRAFT_3872767 [Mycena olivaceomarginata]
MTKANIISAFRKTGIRPLDPTGFKEEEYAPSWATSTQPHLPDNYPRPASPDGPSDTPVPPLHVATAVPTKEKRRGRSVSGQSGPYASRTALLATLTMLEEQLATARAEAEAATAHASAHCAWYRLGAPTACDTANPASTLQWDKRGRASAPTRVVVVGRDIARVGLTQELPELPPDHVCVRAPTADSQQCATHVERGSVHQLGLEGTVGGRLACTLHTMAHAEKDGECAPPPMKKSALAVGPCAWRHGRTSRLHAPVM